jgi:ribosomal protein L37E
MGCLSRTVDDTDLIACPHCGTKNYPTDEYCDQCHFPLAGVRPPPEHDESYTAVDADHLRCKSCGGPLPPTKVGDVAICAYCNTSQVVEFDPERAKSSPPPPPPVSWDDDIDRDPMDDMKPRFRRRSYWRI